MLAYDAAARVWLANTLALAPGVTRLTIHRSTNGITLDGPDRRDGRAVGRASRTTRTGSRATTAPASPFRGRCYLAYTLLGGRDDELAVQRSDDGGRTWSAAVTHAAPVTGVIPVVQPDGRLVLAFWSGRTGMVSVTSTDGGVTLDPAVTISPLTAPGTRGRSARRR